MSTPSRWRRTPRSSVRFAFVPAVLAVLAATVVGCGSGAVGATAAPDASPGITAPPSVAPVTSADEAAAAVKRVNPMLASIEALDPELIGQGSSWQALETGDGWEVTFEVGWGDCFAGCIERHQWRYAVTRTGDVSLSEELGSPLPDDVLRDLTGGVPVGTVVQGVRGLVVAGPVCPVERIPPDPDCAPRPVEGAVLIVRGPDGTEAGRAQTDARGFFELALDPGSYTLEPQPVDGLMGTASPVPFDVAEATSTPLAIEYDTGIR